MLSINGRVRLRRVRWHCPQEGSDTLIDRLLDETEATISEGVREMACRVNQDASSFKKAADNLNRTAHIAVSKETLRTLVEGEGRAVLRAMRRGEISPEWSGKDCTTDAGTTRVFIGCDGVKLPLVTDEEKNCDAGTFASSVVSERNEMMSLSRVSPEGLADRFRSHGSRMQDDHATCERSRSPPSWLPLLKP